MAVPRSRISMQGKIRRDPSCQETENPLACSSCGSFRLLIVSALLWSIQGQRSDQERRGEERIRKRLGIDLMGRCSPEPFSKQFCKWAHSLKKEPNFLLSPMSPRIRNWKISSLFWWKREAGSRVSYCQKLDCDGRVASFGLSSQKRVNDGAGHQGAFWKENRRLFFLLAIQALLWPFPRSLRTI